jgi:hypothetical protein
MLEMFRIPFNPMSALNTLRQLEVNIPSFGGSGRTPSVEYARWSASVYTQLKGTLSRTGFEVMFGGQLRQVALLSDSAELTNVNLAAQDLCEQLRVLADALKVVMDQVSKSERLALVLDTNLIVQYQPVYAIKWAQYANEPVRLVVPLRVLEELEEMRFSKHERLRNISRSELPRLVHLMEASPRSPAPIGDGEAATIELMDFRSTGYRSSWADDEILEFYATLRQFTPRVRLVTSDGPLLVRARYRDFDAQRGPEEYLRERLPSQKTVN